MANFVLNQRVKVRSGPENTWYPGVVTGTVPTEWAVSLDEPHPNADEWEGQARKYGGDIPVTVVTVRKQVEKLTPGEYIRAL
jgi:hypothetical protein